MICTKNVAYHSLDKPDRGKHPRYPRLIELSRLVAMLERLTGRVLGLRYDWWARHRQKTY